jgi:hypothetical protein
VIGTFSENFGQAPETPTVWAADDLLDLTAPSVADIHYDALNPAASTLRYQAGTVMSFADIARIIPCFTRDTAIMTAGGMRAAQDLRAGDRVLTRDNGFQTITWAGRKNMVMGDLATTPDMRPVLIRRGALGGDCPSRDMIVSPNHRVLIRQDGGEVLMAAKHLTHLAGVSFAAMTDVTYIHFMCERHEIVQSDGAWTESFQPNCDAMQAIDSAQRAELLALFPELAFANGRAAYGVARAIAA